MVRRSNGVATDTFECAIAVLKYDTCAGQNGCPIMITLTGLVDPAKLLKAATLDEIRSASSKFHLY
jgi:hypothetical protein